MRHLSEWIVAFRDTRDGKQFHGLKDEALSLLIEAGSSPSTCVGTTTPRCARGSPPIPSRSPTVTS